MSGTWEGRSLEEIATSHQNDRYDVFGSPLTADIPARPAPQWPTAGGPEGEVQPAAQQNYTIGADGKIHGARASYGVTGLNPDGDGGGAIIQGPPPQVFKDGAYTHVQGPYGGADRTGGPQVPPVNSNYYGTDWGAQIGNQISDAPTRVFGASGSNDRAIMSQRRANIIAASLYTQFNPDAFSLGAIGGVLGATYLPYWGDRVFKYDWWRKNYSPIQAEADVRQEKAGLERRKVQTARDDYRTYNEEWKTAKEALKESELKREDIANKATIELQRMGQPGQSTPVEFLAQNEKVKAFDRASDPKNIDLNDLKTHIYTKPEEMNAGRYLSQDEFNTLQQHRNNYNAREVAANKMAGPLDADGLRNGGELNKFWTARGKLAAIDEEIKTLQNNPKAVKVGPFSGYTDRTGNVLGFKAINDRISPETPWWERKFTEWRAAGPEIKAGAATGRTVFKLSNAAGEGILAFGVGVLADAAGDYAIGKHQYPDNAKIAQSLEIPLAGASLLFINNPVAKLFGVASSVVGTKLIDRALGGSNNATYSEFFKPNPWEAGAMGAAWMLPARSAGARMAALGLAWVVGRTMNVAHWAGVPIWGIGDSAPGAKLWDGVTDSMSSFKSSPSFSSFKNLVDKSTDLSMENEVATGARITTFTHDSAADPSPVKYETLAGLYAGLGNMWIARGSKLDPNESNSHNDKGRILPNSQIDLGGLGTILYIYARENLAMAANYVNKGGGTSADAQRIQQEQQAVQQQLDKVYGPHQMGQIYDRLLTDLRTKVGTTESQFSIEQLTKFEIDLKKRVQNPGANGQVTAVDEKLAARDPQFRAKLYRDLALVDLAVAQFSNERGWGERGKQYYTQAVRALGMSTQFVKDSSDAQQLQEIADRVGPGVGAAIQQQYDSKFKNPFGIQAPRN